MRPESPPLIQSHVFQNFLHPSTHGAQNFRSVLQLFSWEKSRITFEKLTRTQDVTAVFHTWANGRFIDIEGNLRRKELRKNELKLQFSCR